MTGDFTRRLRRAGQGDAQPRWANRALFCAAAAEAMRRIIIDNARRRKAERRGGSLEKVSAAPRCNTLHFWRAPTRAEIEKVETAKTSVP